jgi:glucokinase
MDTQPKRMCVLVADIGGTNSRLSLLKMTTVKNIN